MTPTALFLGPSLPGRLAPRHPDLRLLPPVRRGDVPALLSERPAPMRLAVVDGEFGQSLSVSVTELRDALRQGIEVWGASSMGALRAAECSVLGMRGVGWIHQQYATGAIEADDEVALLFDPATHRPLTVPLVNVRWALRLAVGHGVMPAAAVAHVLDVARSLHFEERTWTALAWAVRPGPRRRVTGAPRIVGPALTEAVRALCAFAAIHPLACDRKALDGLLLVSALTRPSPTPEVCRAAA